MRTVKVGLEADVAPYIAGVQGATRATDDLGDELAEAAVKGEALESAAEGAAEAVDDFGDAAARAARQVNKLDGEIDEARRELVGLSAQFADADEASRADLTKGISALEAKLRDLKKNRGVLDALIPDPGELAEAGEKVVESFADGIKAAGSNGPVGVIIGSLLAAAAAPTLGAALAGVVVGGVGLGGIVGGVALAATDPAIQGRGKEIGKNLFAGLKGEAKTALAEPVMAALDDLESAAEDSAVPKLGRIFDAVAPHVDHLTGSLVGAADALLDGFVDATEQGGPAIDALGDLIQSVGESVGEMFTDLSDNADEGADAIHNLATVLDLAVEGVTGLLEALSVASDFFNDHKDALQATSYWLEDHIGWLDLTADGYEKGTAEASAYRRAQAGVATELDKAILAIDGNATATADLAEQHTAAERAALGQRDALVELSSELKAQADPVFGLLDAQDKLRTASEKSAEAIEKHGKNSVEAKKANRDLATAALDLQGKVGALGEEFDGTMTPAMRDTLRAANLTEDQIREVAKQFAAAKRAGDAYEGNYKASVTLSKADEAAAKVEHIRDLLRQVKSKTVSINVVHTTTRRYKVEDQLERHGGAYSTGGPVMGPGTATSDSIPARLSAGEHVWTAAEVQAAGGHDAVERMRAGVLSASPAGSSTRVMPAAATQRIVVESRSVLDLRNADVTAFGSLLAATLRTQPGVRETVRQLVTTPAGG